MGWMYSLQRVKTALSPKNVMSWIWHETVSDGDDLLLEIWGVKIIPSLPLLPSPLWPWVGVSVCVVYIICVVNCGTDFCFKQNFENNSSSTVTITPRSTLTWGNSTSEGPISKSNKSFRKLLVLDMTIWIHIDKYNLNQVIVSQNATKNMRKSSVV